MKVKVLNLKTNKSTSQEVSDDVFGRDYNESLVHQITTAYMAAGSNYAQKVNKKMYKGAISVILSELLRTDRLKVVSDLEIKEPKTKNITSLMKSLDLKDVLLMTDELDENLYLSSRNLYHVGVCDTQSIDPVSLIGYENVVLTKAALKKVEAML